MSLLRLVCRKSNIPIVVDESFDLIYFCRSAAERLKRQRRKSSRKKEIQCNCNEIEFTFICELFREVGIGWGGISMEILIKSLQLHQGNKKQGEKKRPPKLGITKTSGSLGPNQYH